MSNVHLPCCSTQSVDPSTLELRFAVDYDDSVPKKKRTEPAKVLEKDECPYLVAEW